MNFHDFERLSAAAERLGKRVTPVYKGGKTKRYANGETYPYSKYPDVYRNAIGLAIVLDDHVLVDWDGNKPKANPVSLEELKNAMGGLPLLPFQCNKTGTSLHFIFKLPVGVNESELLHSCDGRFLSGVDIKRGNQLVHLKTVGSDGAKKYQNFAAILGAPEAPSVIIDALRRKTFKVDIVPLKEFDGTANARAEAAFQSCVSDFTDMVEGQDGGRNNRLNEIALKWLSIAYSGDLDPKYVESELRKAAELNGCEGVNATITSAKRKALTQPRKYQLGTAAAFQNVSTKDKTVLNDVGNIFELNDAGNADRFVMQHKKNVCFIPEWGWHVFDKVWKKNNLKPRQLMVETARKIHLDAASANNLSLQKSLSEWARKSQNTKQVRDALWSVESHLPSDSQKFNQKVWLFPVDNGTIDLHTGELLPHRHDDYFSKISPVAYSSKAKCESWELFLERVIPDAEIRDFIQRFAGYSLTGLTTEQVFIFLYGSGRNGKSVFTETLAEILGEFNVVTRIETLSSEKNGNSTSNDVAALAGARLVSVSETQQGKYMNESLVKDLTGGDAVSARFLHKEYFQFRPQFKLMIRGNHKPQIRGTDDGIWRRVLLVPFTVQIPENEIDTNLSVHLRNELSGILNWCVQGCLEWQRIGLKPPKAITSATKEYRNEMDVIGNFIEEDCVVSDSFFAGASDLYASYETWCHRSGHRAASVTKFGLALGERGFAKKKPNKVVWHGLTLKSDSPTVSDSNTVLSLEEAFKRKT